ncbi:arsenate reductase/protein-tyrosine-phosphatase family protein [Microbacterium lacticum]
MAHVLFVCTGNICRSPYLEYRLRDALRVGGVGDVETTSAGTRAVTGHPIAGELLGRLSGGGIDAGAHRARQLSGTDVDEADLVLTATRAHRREILRLQPRARDRTFTVLQFSRLLAAAGESADRRNDVAGVVGAALAARGRTAGGDDDDLEDPWGRSPTTYRRVADRMDAGLAPLIQAFTG